MEISFPPQLADTRVSTPVTGPLLSCNARNGPPLSRVPIGTPPETTGWRAPPAKPEVHARNDVVASGITRAPEHVETNSGGVKCSQWSVK